MPPLMVVQTLAESSCSTLSDIKVCTCYLGENTTASYQEYRFYSIQPYIVKHLKEVNEQIAEVSISLFVSCSSGQHQKKLHFDHSFATNYFHWIRRMSS